MSLNCYVIYFIIGGLIGFLYETAVMSVWSGKFESRGFLLGPIIPIYGVGVVLCGYVFGELLPDASNADIFWIAALGSVILEYPTHLILDKAFHQKWWDYSKAPLNINGRISLLSTIGFGIAGIAVSRILNPFFMPLLNRIPENIANILALILAMLFAADFSTTIAVLIDFDDRVSDAEDELENRIGNIVNNVLDEEHPIKDKFYSVVDKVQETPTAVKEKMVQVKSVGAAERSKIIHKTRRFSHLTVERVKAYRKNMTSLYFWKHEDDDKGN